MKTTLLEVQTAHGIELFSWADGVLVNETAHSFTGYKSTWVDVVHYFEFHMRSKILEMVEVI